MTLFFFLFKTCKHSYLSLFTNNNAQHFVVERGSTTGYTMKFHQNLMIAFQLLIFRYQTVFCQCNKVWFNHQEATYLANNVIKTEKAINVAHCGGLCLAENTCVSINYKKSGSDKGKCELNDKLMKDSQENKKNDSDYDYLEIVGERVSPRVFKNIKITIPPHVRALSLTIVY